jgi:hypothetical protein
MAKAARKPAGRAKARAKPKARPKAKAAPKPLPGQYVHVELYSDAPDATRRFFTKVFGWRFEEVSYGPGMKYLAYTTPGGLGGGMNARRDGAFQPPGTLAYVLTADIAKTRRAVEDHGGKVLVPRIEVPNVGTMLVFEAPGGVVQAAWEPDPKYRQ